MLQSENRTHKVPLMPKVTATADDPIDDVISEDEPHFTLQRKKKSSQVLDKSNVEVIPFHLQIWQ